MWVLVGGPGRRRGKERGQTEEVASEGRRTSTGEEDTGALAVKSRRRRGCPWRRRRTSRASCRTAFARSAGAGPAGGESSSGAVGAASRRAQWGRCKAVQAGSYGPPRTARRSRSSRWRRPTAPPVVHRGCGKEILEGADNRKSTRTESERRHATRNSPAAIARLCRTNRPRHVCVPRDAALPKPLGGFWGMQQLPQQPASHMRWWAGLRRPDNA